MEILLIKLALCLLVLFMPVLLLCVSGFVYVREYCKDAGLLILLNIFLAISVLSLVVDKQLSTLTVMAIVGYGVVGVVIIGAMAGSLFVHTWRRMQSRSQLKLIELREEQGTLSQSFLPY